MIRNTGSLAAAADTLSLSQDSRARFALYTVRGTYGSAVLKFEASDNGTNYVPVTAVRLTDSVSFTGNFSPTDNDSVGYIVFAPGALLVRINCVSIGSGSVSVTASSDDTGGTLVLPAAASTSAVEVKLVDGAIATKDGKVVITKAGVCVLTLAAPSAGADDGKRLLITSTTANAHTVTQTSPGFNNGGAASDVATFTGAIGNGMEVVAYNGIWYTVQLRNVTLG